MKKDNPMYQSIVFFLRSAFLSTLAITMSLLAVSAPFAADHACDYLSRDEVTAVLGIAVADGEAHAANPMGQSVCFFDIDAGMALRFAQVQMVRTGWGKQADKGWSAPSLFENNMSFLDNLEKIEGLGEKAYWGGSGIKIGAGLHVLYKDAYFTIQVETGDEAKNLEKTRALASVLLKKID